MSILSGFYLVCRAVHDISEMEYKFAKFNLISDAHSISYYSLSMLCFAFFFLSNVSFVNLCTEIELSTGHGYRIKYKDVQAKNAAMESLLANYTTS